MFKSCLALVIGLAFLAFSAPALAGDMDDVPISPSIKLPHGLSDTALSIKKEDDALRLTPDRNELIRLNQDAASVVVNNPNHVSVLLDSPRLLIVVPHMPGSTSFTVLDGKGRTILQKNVLVTSVQPQHVRIRRMCAGSDASCRAESHFYCPDGCYEVTPVAPASGGSTPPPPATAIGAAASALSGSPQNDPPEGAPE